MNSGATNIDYGNDFGNKKEKLVADLQGVATDASELLKDAANTSIETMTTVRDGFREKIADAKATLNRSKVAVKHAADSTNQYVSENPWKSMGMVAVAALLIGVFLRRH